MPAAAPLGEACSCSDDNAHSAATGAGDELDVGVAVGLVDGVFGVADGLDEGGDDVGDEGVIAVLGEEAVGVPELPEHPAAATKVVRRQTGMSRRTGGA